MEEVLLRASADEVCPFSFDVLGYLTSQVVGRAERSVALWDTAGVLTAPGGVEGNALLQLPIQTPFSSFKTQFKCVCSQSK